MIGPHKRGVGCNTPVLASAVGLRAVAVGAVGFVDEDKGGLLVRERIIRVGHVQGSELADHCERGLSCSRWLFVKGMGKLWGVSGELL
jgi:hypothetical protein